MLQAQTHRHLERCDIHKTLLQKEMEKLITCQSNLPSVSEKCWMKGSSRYFLSEIILSRSKYFCTRLSSKTSSVKLYQDSFSISELILWRSICLLVSEKPTEKNLRWLEILQIWFGNQFRKNGKNVHLS